MLQLLVLPFLACLLIAGIHCWLGLHVVKRGIIFVDLALAQVAALGTVVALLLGHEMHDPLAHALSLGFVFVAAALFALSRFREGDVPQEALIGIAYAVASALAILVLDRSPHGQEEVKNMLVGSILFVTKEDVGWLALLYAVLGGVHVVFRRQFLLISEDPEEARRRGMKLVAWDFLFYVTFGIVIVQSVRLAGVLLVFSYLIVPATCAVLLAGGRGGRRLVIGWILGFLGSVMGLVASAKADLPTGAAIVAAFGVILVVVLAIRPLVRREPASAGATA